LLLNSATSNGADVTEFAVESNGYLMLEAEGENDYIYLLNVRPLETTMSSGPISDLSVAHKEKEKDALAVDVYYFKWYFSNSYDDVTGVANVALQFERDPGGDKFVLKMELEGGDVILYSGNVE